MSEQIDNLRTAIETMHHCAARHVASEPVIEHSDGYVVWDGVVETFDLKGNTTATRCYAWSYKEARQTRHVVLLGILPVDSAETAVRVAIAAEAKYRRYNPGPIELPHDFKLIPQLPSDALRRRAEREADTAAAMKVLSQMPAEIFDLWIGPLISDVRWPFLSVHDCNRGTVWRKLFCGKSIQYIAQLQWERREMPFASIRFEPFSEQRVKGLFTLHILGIDNRLADIRDSRERFLSCREFTAETGRVPAPALLMVNDKDYAILDGNHRIAALASLPNAGDLILDCWIGN